MQDNSDCVQVARQSMLPSECSIDSLDLFEDSLSAIFGDIIVSHGDPGSFYHYRTRGHGDITLRLTTTDSWEEQLKFSHYVWVAGLNLADRIDAATLVLRDLRVLELGAGAGLCGILAALVGGARETVLSDYPAESMLSNLTDNIDRNITVASQRRQSVHVVGHVWGENVNALLEAGGGGGGDGRFDAIILGDCLWMPEQHDALCRTLVGTLRRSTDARIHCVAGFHSGRAKLAPFFKQIEAHGLIADEDIHELRHDGHRRPWSANAQEMDPIERKRWLVVAELRWMPETLSETH